MPQHVHPLFGKMGSSEKLRESENGFPCLHFLFKILRRFGFWQIQSDHFSYKCYNVLMVAGQISFLIANWLTVYIKAHRWNSFVDAFEDLTFALTSKLNVI